MPVMVVTLLAQEGRPRLEQAADIGAMRVMADAAVFRHWLVVVHKRTTLFHVAGIAGVVGAALDQGLRIVAMDVVAGRA